MAADSPEWTVDTLREHLTALRDVDVERIAEQGRMIRLLQEQAATHVTRTEYEAAHQSLIHRMENETKVLSEHLSEMELRLTSRLDKMAGEEAGQAARTATMMTTRQQLIMLVSVLIAAAAASGVFDVLFRGGK